MVITMKQQVAVKERPIPFSGEMVRAILDNRKTQTRRICKHEGVWFNGHPMPDLSKVGKPVLLDLCPYGQLGDRLWVRERVNLEEKRGKGLDIAVYASDGETTLLDTWSWKRDFLPARFCPRGLSRINLEITGIRVERLQDIEREDVYAEGIHGPGLVVGEVFMLCTGQPTIESAEVKYILDQFIDLWDSLNTKRGYSWAINPWVWVIEFRRIDEPAS